jgi:hypothetical protein
MKKLPILFSLLLTTSTIAFAADQNEKETGEESRPLILTDKDKVTDQALIDQLNKMVAREDGQKKDNRGTGVKYDTDCINPHFTQSLIAMAFTNTASISKLKPHCLDYADIHIDEVDGDYDSLVRFMDYSVAETFFAYQYEFVSGPTSCETNGMFADPVWFYGNSMYTGLVSLQLDDPLTMMVNENCHYQVQLITARQNSDGSTVMGGYSNFVEIVNNF